MNLHEIEKVLLINLSETEKNNYSELVKKILAGDLRNVINDDLFCSNVKKFEKSTEMYFDQYMDLITDSHIIESWLSIGIALLLYFIQQNWVGPFESEDFEILIPFREQALSSLSVIDQCNENTVQPELLFLAKTILANSTIQNTFSSSIWWLFRAICINQQIIDEESVILFDQAESLLNRLSNLVLSVDDINISTLYYLEAAHFYLLYRRVDKTQTYLDEAINLSGLTLDLKGALGKRTKYQENDKAQLFLDIQPSDKKFKFRICDNLPKPVHLNDDIRLDSIQFAKPLEHFNLGNIESAIIMATYFYKKISSPKDEIVNEELDAILSPVIDSTMNYSLKISSLFQRSIIESDHKRTVERSLIQLEYLIDQLKSKNVLVEYRIDSFFISGMKPIWSMKQSLANIMLSLGLIKGSLEIFLNLSLWEDVIVCYTLLDLKDRATEIIKQELSKKPSVKLWCLLGDSTDNVEHYETAWELSQRKSSKAQKCWGMHYFRKHNYKEAINHLQKSVDLNNIQESVWYALGFAALQVEDWKLAVTAYKSYCSLDSNNFEIWNNLANAYIKLGEKSKARRCLQDAIKCNWDNWKVWDNYMIVNTDLGYYSVVLECYHHILDIKEGNHIDLQVLHILCDAIINNILDGDNKPSKMHLSDALKLFGRLTATNLSNPDIWRFYGDLTSLKKDDISDQKALQCYQKAYKSTVMNQNWYKDEKIITKILSIHKKMMEKILESEHLKMKKDVLSSTKLLMQSSLKKIRDNQTNLSDYISKTITELDQDLQAIILQLEKL